MTDFHTRNVDVALELRAGFIELENDWRRRLIGWLLIANAGGIGAAAALAANLANPANFLYTLAPSLWSLYVGLVLAGFAGALAAGRAYLGRRAAGANASISQKIVEARARKKAARIDHLNKRLDLHSRQLQFVSRAEWVALSLSSFCFLGALAYPIISVSAGNDIVGKPKVPQIELSITVAPSTR